MKNISSRWNIIFGYETNSLIQEVCCVHLWVEITSLSLHFRCYLSVWIPSVIISLSTNRKHAAGPTKAMSCSNHNTIVVDGGSVQVQALCSQNNSNSSPFRCFPCMNVSFNLLFRFSPHATCACVCVCLCRSIRTELGERTVEVFCVCVYEVLLRFNALTDVCFIFSHPKYFKRTNKHTRTLYLCTKHISWLKSDFSHFNKSSNIIINFKQNWDKSLSPCLFYFL